MIPYFGSDEMIGLHFDTLSLPEANGHPACTLCAHDPIDYARAQMDARGLSFASMFPAFAENVPAQPADASAGSATPVESVSLTHPLAGVEDAVSRALRTTVVALLAVGLILLGLWWVVNA